VIVLVFGIAGGITSGRTYFGIVVGSSSDCALARLQAEKAKKIEATTTRDRKKQSLVCMAAALAGMLEATVRAFAQPIPALRNLRTSLAARLRIVG
jgi:hypothetical protein